MRNRRFLSLSIGLATALAAPGLALADGAESATCSEYHEIDAYQLLRRLSFDLKNQAPDYSEYADLDGRDQTDIDALVTPLVDQYMQSDEFRLAMRRYHEQFLWSNVSNVKLINGQFTLNTVPGTNDVYYVENRGQLLRGVPKGGCADQAQSGEVTVDNEGWVQVHPYWEPEASTKIKVCAFDAQDAAKSGGIDCNTPEGQALDTCGCGSNLRYCFAPKQATSQPVLADMREQLLLSIDDVTTGGQPYSDIIASKRQWQNGRLQHFRKYTGPATPYKGIYSAPDPKEDTVVDEANEAAFDNPDFNDGAWYRVDRTDPGHAGILTLPGYLLRFQTNRGRFNRFRQAFQCQSFIPPDDIEDPTADSCSADAGDLTKRCTCRYCHNTVEPSAAFFGRVAESGYGFTTDTARFPVTNDICKTAGGNGPMALFCQRFYTAKTEENPGVLRPLQYADFPDGGSSHPDYIDNSDRGPAGLAQDAIDDGSFATCAATKVFTFFVKRAPDDGELETVDGLAEDFKSSNYDFKTLVREVVLLSQYRRVR